MKAYKYLFSLTVPLSISISLFVKGASWFALIYAFLIIPALEFIFKSSNENLSSSLEQKYVNSKYFDLILWMTVLSHFVLFYYFLEISYQSKFDMALLGKIVSIGIACGVVGINVAHELGHRKSFVERYASLTLLLTSQYMHFQIEHNKGHHRHVATPLDPATARYNESLYQFIPRSVIGSWLSTFKLDRKQTLVFGAIQVLLILIIYYFYDLKTMLAFILAATIGFILLEIVNYIEHYGLNRNVTSSGRFEKVLPKHSWNSDFIMSRLALFELSRHSDHHANASRKYQVLRSFEDAPQMPTGYPGMMLLSLIPTLWFKVMNKRLKVLGIANG